MWERLILPSQPLWCRKEVAIDTHLSKIGNENPIALSCIAKDYTASLTGILVYWLIRRQCKWHWWML